MVDDGEEGLNDREILPVNWGSDRGNNLSRLPKQVSEKYIRTSTGCHSFCLTFTSFPRAENPECN